LFIIIHLLKLHPLRDIISNKMCLELKIRTTTIMPNTFFYVLYITDRVLVVVAFNFSGLVTQMFRIICFREQITMKHGVKSTSKR
jgi:hypothetical protein